MRVLLFFVLFPLFSRAQLPSIGQWRDHLPYNRAHTISESPEKIFCATLYAVFSYNKTDKSIQRISKATGLSDVGVSTIKYHSSSGYLIIAYNNGNIDLFGNNEIINISDIKRSLITAGKNINRITVINDLAYLACGYGISILDIAKKEIKETYFIGDSGTYINVNDIAFDDVNIYAATSSGIYEAELNNPNLADYHSWKKNTVTYASNGKFNHIEVFGNKVIANLRASEQIYESDTLYEKENGTWEKVDSTFEMYSMENSSGKLLLTFNGLIRSYDSNWATKDYVYTYGNEIFIEPRHAVFGAGDTLWIADNRQGLIKNWNTWSNEIIAPNGAGSIFSYQMNSENGKLIVATGKRSKSNGNNWWLTEGILFFENDFWTVLNKNNESEMQNLIDVVNAKIDPSDDRRAFAGSLGGGMISLYDRKITTKFNEVNSSLRSPDYWYYIGISGIDFDSDYNVWVANTRVPNALSVRTVDKKWQSFPVPELSNEIYIGNVLVNQSGHKWIELPYKGIVVFDDNNTIFDLFDDRSILLNSAEGSGALHNLAIQTMAEDREGKIWVGTEAGIAVFYNPGNVFSGGNFDAQRILVSQGGYNGYLLETETVTAISVDGADRKWVGTDGAGVFLLSDDGTQQLLHFTEENSPLLSNFVSCIAVNDKTGEVFFGTENGICSYKSDATEGAEEFHDVYAYPNPVRSGYNGPIAIKNLVTDAVVKITDVSGSLVFETTALGGQAIWYGKDRNGNRVKSGVYLAFCSNPEGTKITVAKILFLN